MSILRGSQVIINPASTGTSNNVLEIHGSNKTGANGDEAYIRFLLDDDGGASSEVARLIWEINDASAGSENGEFRFEILDGGTKREIVTFNQAGVNFNNQNITGFDCIVHGLNNDQLFRADSSEDSVRFGGANVDGAAFILFGSARRLPARLYYPRFDQVRGFEYRVWAGIQDGVRDERPPSITKIVAGVFSYEGEPGEE